jgi:predicted DsbA family dithiol-disulfide isomerase/uncharacterized membrane protein
VALVIALLGVVLSLLTLTVHHRLAAGGGYTSFCNLGGIVDCDAVLTSRYGRLLGVSVAAWGVGAFALGALLALPGAIAGPVAGAGDLALLGLVSGSLGFALVMAVAMASLGRVCLLCLGLDAVVLAWFATVVPLHARFDAASPAGWWRGRAAARAIVAGATVLAVAGGTLAAVRGPGPASTVAEVRAQDPRFYRWYTGLPAVAGVSDLAGPAAHHKGPADATVAIVEFSDFQCPFCAEAFRDLRDIMRARHDVSITFRHYPLDATCNSHLKRSLHPDACLAARAAECAGQQERFWEYHDVLFENHDHLERESLFRYARELHLDLAAFRHCLDAPATLERIREDIEAGGRVGVASTPTLFINGRRIEGALDRTHYDYAVIIEAHDRHAPGSAPTY